MTNLGVQSPRVFDEGDVVKVPAAKEKGNTQQVDVDVDENGYLSKSVGMRVGSWLRVHKPTHEYKHADRIHIRT